MSALPTSAHGIASAFAKGEVSARDIALATLERIAAIDPRLNAYTAITTERALAEAEALDRRRQRGETLPPLAGVPYAVKNLFNVEGLTTLAGAKLLAGNPPARHDAVLVQRMQAGGALLSGALNMDALAYGFTTENTHYGVTRNPHDHDRVAGGSSGGSGAAIAAGLVPITLGSDTNGSIRVPASLCGVFGLKPTFGRLPRSGSFPFVHSFDHLGPLATSATDLALAYDAMQGPDPQDRACAQQPAINISAQLALGATGLRVGLLTGYFEQHAGPQARQAARAAAKALSAADEVTLPGTAAARAAAFVITAAQGGALHLAALRDRPEDFEPLSRERLTAGALVPATWVHAAQCYREHFRRQAMALFEQYDLLIAAATPVCATVIGQPQFEINGNSFPTRPSMGLLTQPISFIGLPVAVAPLWQGDRLPIGVQLIAAPWREDVCLRAAHALEEMGIAEFRSAA